MKISIETTSYNERRYSKPYIARMDFTDPNGTPTWGDWIGDRRNGSAGLLEIEASAGDVLMRGQKDNRNPRNSAPEWYVVEDGGTLRKLNDKVEAVRAFRTSLARQGSV